MVSYHSSTTLQTTSQNNQAFPVFSEYSQNHNCSRRQILWQQAILMKYHALFINFENAAKFEIVVCCKI